jgi:hypothetical protein
MNEPEGRGALALALAVAVAAALLVQTWFYGNYIDTLDRRLSSLERTVDAIGEIVISHQQQLDDVHVACIRQGVCKVTDGKGQR